MTNSARFQAATHRGRQFEAEERAGWTHMSANALAFEAPSQWKDKRGRIDILVDDASGMVAIVEIKATDWDNIRRDRVRPTALRHTRQIWRYIDDFVETRQVEVSPGIVYQFRPRLVSTQRAVERALEERGIQCVWRSLPRSSQRQRFKLPNVTSPALR